MVEQTSTILSFTAALRCGVRHAGGSHAGGIAGRRSVTKRAQAHSGALAI